MNRAIVHYIPALVAVTGAIAITALLMIVSVVVTNGKNLHAGLTPTEIGSLPFRAFRAHHNTLENNPAFAATTVLAILVSASPMWVNVTAVVYLLARVLHPAFYYANVAPARAGAFNIGLLAWLSMLGAVFVALMHG